MYTLELTEEELKFLYDRCSRKAQRLEEAHLKDIPCYRLSYQLMSKIYKVQHSEQSSTAEQIFRDIDNLHLHVDNEFEARAYEELKKKYGVK